MNKASRKVQRIYLTLLLFNTLAASLIWGINTLFLLDAGLNNTETFAANAFFTFGFMIFEIPTGVVADLRGRRVSYLLGVITLALSTLRYLFMWYRTAPVNRLPWRRGRHARARGRFAVFNSHPGVLGALLWGGLYLRNERLRSLVPLQA